MKYNVYKFKQNFYRLFTNITVEINCVLAVAIAEDCQVEYVAWHFHLRIIKGTKQSCS
jgi:hypothetical protein